MGHEQCCLDMFTMPPNQPSWAGGTLQAHVATAVWEPAAYIASVADEVYHQKTFSVVALNW